MRGAVLLRAALHSFGAVLPQLAAFFRSAAICCEHVEVQGPIHHDAASAALLDAVKRFALVTSVSKTASSLWRAKQLKLHTEQAVSERGALIEHQTALQS